MSTVVLPSGWPRPRGFSEARVDERSRILVIAGQIGRDPQSDNIPADFGEQWGIALSRIADIVASAGGTSEDVLSLSVFVVDLKQYNASASSIGAHFQRVFGRHYPAMTLLEVSALMEPAALLEVQALASV